MKKIALIYFITALISGLAAYGLVAEGGEGSSTTQTNTESIKLPGGGERINTTEITYGSKLLSRKFIPLAFGIISAACFCCSAFLISKDQSLVAQNAKQSPNTTAV